MSWTPQQEEALHIRNKNLLLAAAAGSGKTAVLTERITRLVEDPGNHTDINELLVLTFTKAAASEMKTRVSQALARELEKADRENQADRIHHLERQISLLGSAQISTLDSFFQSLFRQYFYLLDLDPKTQMLTDANESYLLQESVLAEVLENWYSQGDPDFLDTADFFASRYQDSLLKETILKIHRYACSMPFPEVWIRSLPENYHFSEEASMDSLPWSHPILEQLIATAEKITDLYRQAFAIMENNKVAQAVYGEQFSQEYSFFSAFGQVTTWQELYHLPSFRYATIQRATKTLLAPFRLTAQEFNNSDDATALKDLRDKAKKEYTQHIIPFLQISEKQWMTETRSMYSIAKTLSHLALDFSKAYEERKKQESLMDFNDLEHYVLDILLDTSHPDFTPQRAADFPSETALSIREKYKEVMIDEYQDTNGIQELIAMLISRGNNRFLVGDIKQSIYRFRQADPTIFLQKYNTFSTTPDAVDYRIDLNKNFRSDATILSSINFLFRQIMTEKNLELSYGDAESLYPGRHEETRPENYVGGSVSIEFIDQQELQDSDIDSELKELDNIQWEGRLIARRIQDMMEKGQQVMNKDGSFRPLTYGDIVILLRSVSTKGPALLQVLESYHIPSISDREDDFVKNVEVEILWALLKILDNPLQDLALTAVLRSFLVGLDETDLSKLYLAKKKQNLSELFPLLSQAPQILTPDKARCVTDFLTHFQNWRRQSMQDGLAPLLRLILDDTDYLTYVSGLPGGNFRKAHVLAFYQLARQRDQTSHNGLYPFLQYLSRLVKENKSFTSQIPSGTAADAVRIMTIHRSKGLEFPIVFLADCGKSFNLQDAQDIAICHKNLGLGLQYYDKEHHLRWPTLYWYAVRAATIKESAAEEARLLYVAMTRARDKLFLISARKNVENDLKRYTIPLAGTGGKNVVPLPSHMVANGKSYMDWIFPAALHHRSMKKAWELANTIPSYQEETPEGETAFSFTITKEKELFTEEEQKSQGIPLAAPEATVSPKASTNRRAAFLRQLPSEIPPWMDWQLTWHYPSPGAVHTPSKLTATAAVKLREAQEYAASDEPPYSSVTLADDLPEEGNPSDLPSDYSEVPSFLAEDTPVYTGTTFGTLMHKAMEMLDFTTLPATEEDIRKEIQNLANSQVFTEEENKTLLSYRKRKNPIAALLTFAESPLCQAMKEASVIRKEMPFSILLPAHDFYPDCETGEKIFLQGVMDCMLEDETGITIIDYKTDHTMTEDELRNHYKIQLQVYGEAAEKLLGKPVQHLYLWSFTFGKAIEVEKRD